MISSRDRRFVIDQAIEAVREALWDGRDKHPEDWRTVSIEDHCEHIDGHNNAIGACLFSNLEINLQDVSNLLCRAAMIRAKLKLENEPNEGDE